MLSRMPIERLFSLITMMNLTLRQLKSLAKGGNSSLNAKIALDRIEAIEGIKMFDAKIFRNERLEIGEIICDKAVFNLQVSSQLHSFNIPNQTPTLPQRRILCFPLLSVILSSSPSTCILKLATPTVFLVKSVLANPPSFWLWSESSR